MESGGDIQSYFHEVATALKDLEGSEDDSRALLAQNALEEIAGQELTAATSPATAFTLEKLLAEAELQAVLSFLRAVLNTDEAFGKMSSDSTGSYIVEQVLEKIAAEQETADEGTRTLARQALNGCCDAITDSLEACITDRCASHVARRLLSTAAGRDVSPAASKAKPLPSVLFEDDEAERPSRPLSKDGKPTGLAGRLGGTGRSHVTAPFPQVIIKMTSAAIGAKSAGQLAELAYHPHASPFLQALIEANADSGRGCEQLVACLLGAPPLGNGSFSAAAINPAAVHDMMNDRTGSHVLEAVFRAAPPELFERLWDRALQGRLPALAAHPCANFAVQAALAGAHQPQQVKEAVVELQDSFAELLGRNRSGVVASIFAAAGRLKAAQSEACRALSQGLTALPAANTNKRGLAVALLTLDGAGQLGGSSSGGPGAECAPGQLQRKAGRLSSTGCAILALLLRFPLDASQKFAKAVSTLSPEDAAIVGSDAGGSRVLEAFIQGPASTKQKKALMQQLRGSWAAVALTLPGSHLVQTCFGFSGGKAREDLVAELAAGRKALYASRRGPQLIQLTGADTYARSPAEWRERAAAGSAVRADFAELLGDLGIGNSFAGNSNSGGVSEGAKARDTVLADAASGLAASDAASGQAAVAAKVKKQPKKSKKKRDPLSDAFDVAIAAGKVAAAEKLAAAKTAAPDGALGPAMPTKPSKASTSSSIKNSSHPEASAPDQAATASTAAAADKSQRKALNLKKSKRKKFNGTAFLAVTEAAADREVMPKERAEPKAEGQTATEAQKRSKEGASKAEKAGIKRKRKDAAKEQQEVRAMALSAKPGSQRALPFPKPKREKPHKSFAV